MRFLFAIIMLFPLTLFGQTKAVINGPTSGNPGDLIILDASQSDGKAFAWTLIGNKTFLAVDNGRKCVFASGTPGVYVFVLSVAGETAENQVGVSVAKHAVTIGQPGPGPGPEPGPDPGPEPSPAPIPVEGFRVLIIEESADRTKLPRDQLAIILGRQVREYLDANCVKDGYRIYDKDVDMAGETDIWKKAMQRRPESTPWVIISNGKTGYEGPLPSDPKAFIELCGKYEK